MKKNSEPIGVDKEAQITKDLYARYQTKAQEWRSEAQLCNEYRLGNQISKDVADALKERGQAPFVDNRIHPAIEQLKAMLTFNRPRFLSFAREDSDQKVAHIIGSLLEYIWYISDGNMNLKQAIDDYAVKGKGYMYVYYDPNEDLGKGEVKLTWLDAMSVYTDPDSKDRYDRDCETKIIHRQVNRGYLKTQYPDYVNLIAEAECSSDANYGGSSITVDRDKMTHVPGDIQNEDGDLVDLFDRLTKVSVFYYRIFDKRRSKEYLLLKKDYDEFEQQLTYVLTLPNGTLQYFDSAEEAVQSLQMITQQMPPEQVQAMAQGQSPIKTVTMVDLIKNGIVEVGRIIQTRVRHVLSVGNKFLSEEILPCSEFPLIPIPNIWTGTPFPMSDVKMAMGLQDFINKMRSLIIAHTTASTNIKLLLPKGSADTEDIEKSWGKPNAVILYDPTMGEPHMAQPSPFPSELFNNVNDAIQGINYQFGIYDVSYGNSQSAPPTVKGTMLLDEYGQRRIKSKLDDIEYALNILARVCVEFIQNYYTIEKTVRIVNPNNTTTEFTMNQKLYDEFTGEEIETALDITSGRYDVQILTGSTLPTNRFAKLESYMQLYEKGIIGPRMVLTATEVVDVEKALAEVDTIQKQTELIGGLQEEIKKLKGDLQTRDREAVSANKQTEVEKFKADLNSIQSELKAQKELGRKRMQDMMDLMKKKFDIDLKGIKDSQKVDNKESKKEKKND